MCGLGYPRSNVLSGRRSRRATPNVAALSDEHTPPTHRFFFGVLGRRSTAIFTANSRRRTCAR